jgi:hypothetical protein
MTSLLQAKATLAISKDAAVVYAAFITGAVGITAAVTTGIFAVRNEKSRQRHADTTKTQELAEARTAARHTVLRLTAADFATTAVELAEHASAITRDPTNSDAVGLLWTANGNLRKQYQALLISESTDVQETARRVLRAAWNERQQALGKERKHNRLLSSDAAPIKEMRANLRPFVAAVRSELGVEGELAPDLDDQ